MLISICFRFLLINLVDSHAKVYEETSFDTLPNLYMEHLGDVRFFHETYSIVSYFNLDELTLEESEIYKGLEIIDKLCNDQCNEKNLIKRIRNQLEITRKNKYKMFSAMGVPTLFRYKRGVFNFVGKISKILFGTLSEDDAEYYNSEIDAVHKDNKRISELFQNQTSILQLSLQKTEGLFIAYSEKFKEMHENIKVLDENLRKLEEKEIQLQKESLITEMCFEIEIAVMELERNIDILIESVVLAKIGTINPRLLSPDLLMSSINLMKNEKGNDRMPIPISNGNYFEYLEVSEVVISIIEYRLVHIIKIPILELSNYKAYRVIPAPKLIKENLLAYITTPDDYIITNDEKLLYSPTDERYLKDCKTHKKHYFCKSIFPKYYIKAHDACISKIVNNPTKLKEDDCTIKLISVKHTMWIQFMSNDKWLYSAPTPEIIKIICNNKVEEKLIEGTKVLWVAPGCTVVSDDVTFHSYLDNIIDNNAFIPLIKNNFSNSFKIFDESNLNLSLIKIHNIETPDTKIGDLTKFGTRLHEIVREAAEIGNHERSKTWYERSISWLTYTLYAIGTLSIFYILNKFKIFHFLKCLITGAFQPCIRTYNYCLFNYGNNNRNQNSCGTNVRMRNLNLSESDSVSSIPSLSPTRVRRAIRDPMVQKKIRKSRLQISEFANE